MEILDSTMVVNFPEVAHDDHPMSDEQLDWIQTHPEIAKLDVGTFICDVFELPKELGTMPSALYGPDAGDEPVTEEEVTYVVRGQRGEESRMIDKPVRRAKNVCVIGLVGKVAFTLYGTQSSKPSPREPWDKGFATEEEKQEAEKFWSEHALSINEGAK